MRWVTWLCLLLIVLAGLGLRLYGLDWDQGRQAHPDERYVAWVAASLRLPGDPEGPFLNPHRWPSGSPRSFSYGHFPLYLQALAGGVGGRAEDAQMIWVGRILSALFDTVTILFTFALGRALYGERVGLLGAAFVALTVIHIQQAHFATYDAITTTLIVGALLFSVRWARLGHPSQAIWAGIWAGLAVGSKFSAVLVLLPLILAHLLCWEEISTLLPGATIAKHPRKSAQLPRGEGENRVGATLFGEGLLTEANGVRSASEAPTPTLPRRRGREPNLPPASRGGLEGGTFSREEVGGQWLRGPVGWLALSLLAALIAFALTNPFALIEWDAFVSEMQTQSQMLRGAEEFPFTLQYHTTRPYLYQVEQLLRWGMGLPLGLLALGGVLYALYRAWCYPLRPEEWIPLAWVILYFGLVGSWQVKFVRYLLPLSPVLAVYAARLLDKLRVASRKQHKSRITNHIARSLTALVLLVTTFYALAFLNVYRGEHPWLTVSRWIYEHVPPGSTLALETWDEPLPFRLVEEDPGWHVERYRVQWLDWHPPDTPDKLDERLERLAASDYLIVASNRIYGSTCRWPDRYPLTCRYYRALFSGELGFELAAFARRDPALGPVGLVSDPFGVVGLPSPLPPGSCRVRPVTLNLGRADESFSVYEHPLPLVFRNVGRLSPAEMEALFAGLLLVD